MMVGAHIDSVLRAPGAHDDASGNGVSMEIARVVSKLPLDKEIRIGGFGGEEDGLTGSRAYVATLPAEERARFVGEWQMDMVGTPHPPARLWALTPDGRSNFVVDEAYDRDITQERDIVTVDDPEIARRVREDGCEHPAHVEVADLPQAGDTAVEFSSFERNTPSAECDFERGSAAQSRAYFEDQYAANPNGRNAFGRCVSQKAGG